MTSSTLVLAGSSRAESTDVGWDDADTDCETADFAVRTLRCWWRGPDRAPARARAVRPHVRKPDPPAALALETSLEIAVCHFPPGIPGISTWNSIEHQLFSRVTTNWRGRLAAGHDVIVTSIAATTTPTGVTVRSEPGTAVCKGSGHNRDRQSDARPLDRHGCPGDWHHGLRPERHTWVVDAADPFAWPSPDLAWLCHPGLTGMQTEEWDTLITTLTALHQDQREVHLDKRRGHRPRIKGDGRAGRRPVLTLADRLLAALLHYRLGLPQTVIARLFTVAPATVNRRIRDIRQLLDAAGYIIPPAGIRLATLDDLHRLASTAGITHPSRSKKATG